MTINLIMESFPPGEIVSHLSRQHPALFSTVVEQSSVAISVTDPQARIVYTNPAFCRLTGFSLSQLLGQNHRILASQQTPGEVYSDMWQTLLQGSAWRGQLINRRRDGSLYLAEIDITPIVNAQGELEHYLAMHKDISASYALEQRLRNHMTLMTAVLNNIPAAVVVVDEKDRVIMDNLAYKTLCADCGGKELLSVLDYGKNKDTLREGRPLPVMVRGAVRWLMLGSWALPGVNEEASRYFTDSALPRTLIVITDCTEQQQQQQQGRLDRLKQQIANGILLAAIRESLGVAMVQLNCPLNMLAAARRLNGEDRSNVALESAWREGEEAMARLQACRPSLAFETEDEWSVKSVLDDLMSLYHSRLSRDDRLQYDVTSPQLIGFGQRTQVLACLSLWLDRTLALAAEIAPFQLTIQIYAREERGWLSLYLEDNVPMTQVRFAPAPATLSSPGKGMELRLIQTLVADHQGAIDLSAGAQGGTCLILRFPLLSPLTGGAK
ncbi:nitrogen fixation negative regulator NifL [Pectobacterium versatile]|uniref:nitrogen fixation negative regulator NifL n=1 Tax=Pectobacterium versatile TaxID=2488639 RepID=UPI000D61F774|nr:MULTISPECIES: nitrogen fixation negative regulator NifL [Pectobacterium]MBA0162189.1 nitrogen fixation negative regulator NifL [Pectobacterium versatile]MBN3059376.1 nitrogen fixation negative regulator NifL [Pectobacterium versatile]MBN3239809.1 nitrogen fixation negative regulator NifL [Pectobacterium versatile]PVY74232.1 nitrogen fixation negative regulator NifL [Pectobacterium versatile]PWD68166.1 nitrogen fixation negative regulator NifL [Pectobacterium versatile]